MRRFAMTAAALVVCAAPAFAQSNLRIDMGNAVNVLELEQSQATNQLYLRQTGQRNLASVRQYGQTNTIEIHQAGRSNTAYVGQSASGSNTASINQYDSASAAGTQYGRMSKSMTVDGSDSTYLSAYQNGGISILQITRDAQPYGRLGRR